MQKHVFILKYADGSYVQRDDTSGGYPYPVGTLAEATMWDTAEEAAKYGSISGFRNMFRHVIPLEIQYVEREPIPFPAKWTECNHHCIPTKESTSPEAKHFLDCPIMKDGIEAARRSSR